MVELMNKAKELDIVLWNFIDKYIRLLECHKKLLTKAEQTKLDALIADNGEFDEILLDK